MRLSPLFVALAAGAAPLSAQQGSPYLPLDHWATPFVEHLIARGRMPDPTPLTRPLRRADVARALSEIDTTALTQGERRAVRVILADVTEREQGPWGRIDLHAGAVGANFDNRDPQRPLGAGHATFTAGLGLTLVFGPAVAVTHPTIDTRLKFDPWYQGKKDRVIAGRNPEAYIAVQTRYVEGFFGAVDRNWGPPATQGLIVSPNPYSFAHLGIGVGTAGVRFEGLATQLEDLPDSTGTPNHRYWVAHRLLVRPPGRTTFSLWEGILIAGPDRQPEPWFLNIVNLGLLAQYDENSTANNLLGADVETWVGRQRLFAQFLLDDIQIDSKSASDQEPSAFGFTVGAQGAIGPAAWTAWYTLVSNLAYRTPNVPETVMRRTMGLGRNYSDYDQLTLRASLVAGPGLLLEPEATVIRQGEGDFRLPYPPVSAYDSTPTFHAGVVERDVQLALAARFDRARVGIGGRAGVLFVANADHVTGRSETQFVGSVGVTLRLDWRSALP